MKWSAFKPKFFSYVSLSLRGGYKWIRPLILALVLFSASSVQALTVAQMQTEIRLRTRDAGISTQRQRYTDAQLLNLINQSQRDIVNFTWIIHKHTLITLVSGTTYYTLPTDIIAIDRVTYKNQNIPEQTLAALDSAAQYSAWEQTGGAPSAYFQDPTQSTKIGMSPFPNSASSTGTVKVMYTAQGTDLASVSDVPFNAESRYLPYSDLIIYDVCYKIFLIDGDLPRAQEYRSYYETRLKQMMDTLGRKDNYKPGVAGPNPR